jgi:tRNA(fMet)-specific endonuclease VapC
MKYLLDTSICVFLIRRTPRALLRKIAARPTVDFGVSLITVAELQFGVQRSSDPGKNQTALDAFLLPLTVLDFDYAAALAYGSVRHKLEAAGTPIGALDTLIAAHALSRNLVLLTHNLKEFKRVPGLKVEDWTKA